MLSTRAKVLTVVAAYAVVFAGVAVLSAWLPVR